MFEARLIQGQIIKKILDAVKDLVTEATWECSPNGLSLQAMDTSHVSLVTAQLKSEGFDHYRCDKPLNLGMNLPHLTKIIKCAGNDDTITIKAIDDEDKECDKITLLFEDKNETETSEYEMKLINLDSEYLGIPEQDSEVEVEMPSSKFARICKDLSSMGEAVTISCVKESVRFQVQGDLGSGSVNLVQKSSADKPDEAVCIKMVNPICLSFSLKYLNHFSKAAPLSPRVKLLLKAEAPLVVSFSVKNEEEDTEIGFIRYYLAPKIEDGDNMEA
ncbi:Proliferating cell nuclear antigen, partial [Fragariocoptes setiger]